MKITEKTIKLVTVLSIFLSLAFITASLIIHLDENWKQKIEGSTASESTSLSIDSIEGTNSLTEPACETSSESNPIDETSTGQLSDITASVTVLPQTSEQETTFQETTVIETTAAETTAEETTTIETTTEVTTAEVTTETESNQKENSSVPTEDETTSSITEPLEDTTPETTEHIHIYSDWNISKEATCETEGRKSRTCECGNAEILPIQSLGHKEKKLPAFGATCTSEGKTLGSVCSVCNKVLVKQTSIPKLECDYSNLICINCGQIKDVSVSLTAPYAGLYKADSLECLYSSSAETKTPPASLTKMITACVAIENMPLDTVITVGSELSLVPKYSSLCYIYKGNKIKLYDLLTGMLLCSGNDAAYAIAANVGRYVNKNSNMSDQEAVDYFCGLMNNYAIKIGAKNTHFTTPDGSDSKNQYSTVKDLAIITAHAMDNNIIAEIVSIHYKKVVFASGQIAKWTNTNELINPDSDYYTEEVTGFKTGGTEKAGKCLSATFEDNGETYIAIVLGCENNDARYENILKLIELITKD